MLSIEKRLQMLTCPHGPVDMVLDTDAYNEIDDQFAIAYALSAKEKLTVKALYAAPFSSPRYTNPADGMELSYQEIQNLLHLMGRNVPVFRGAKKYLPDEKTPVASDVVDDLCARAMEYTPDHPLYVVGIAAITDVASALLTRPEIADRVVVVWLGGHALHWHDNRYEANIEQDVAAARVVFDSGVPLVIVPCLGVASVFSTTEPELRHWLSGKNPLCDYLVEHTVEFVSDYASGKVWSRVLWDVNAVGWLLNDKNRFMLDQILPTPVPEYDLRFAQDCRRLPCRYVYSIHRDALMADLFEHISR